MERKSNFRARVMKRAYQIWKATKKTWSECMRKAWELYRLEKAMRGMSVNFTYQKVDGTLRHAIGTLNNLFLKTVGSRMTKPSYKTVVYYDIEKGGFRSFRVESLVRIG